MKKCVQSIDSLVPEILILGRYPPWTIGTTVTVSPSCTSDSLVSSNDESTPFTTSR